MQAGRSVLQAWDAADALHALPVFLAELFDASLFALAPRDQRKAATAYVDACRVEDEQQHRVKHQQHH